MQCLSSLLVIGHERSFYEIYKDERYCIVLKNTFSASMAES